VDTLVIAFTTFATTFAPVILRGFRLVTCWHTCKRLRARIADWAVWARGILVAHKERSKARVANMGFVCLWVGENSLTVARPE
jgi:hypothetical protein